MGKKLILITIVLMLFSLLTFPPVAAGVSNNGRENSALDSGRAIMVIIDQVSWKELNASNLPNIKRLMDIGASGLMTTNPSGGSLRTPENTYLTIGSGTKIAANQSGGLGFNLTEKYRTGTALDSYIGRTGIRPKGKIVHLGIGQIDKVNEILRYDIAPGAIGTALHQRGYKTAVVGNADLSGEEKEKYRRFAVEIAMDNTGQVDQGNIGLLSNLHDPGFPGGIRTDYGQLLKDTEAMLDKTDFLVIETGDTSRIEKQADFLTEDRLQNLKTEALKNIDGFIAHLMDRIDLKRDLVMITVPGPSGEMMKNGDFLTPFIIAGKDVGTGIIWSGTTRRDGLISNTDLAPTILKHFGLPPVVSGIGTKKDILLNGQIIENRPTPDVKTRIEKLLARTSFMHNARYPFVKTYINLSLAIMIGAIAAFRLKLVPNHWIKPFLVALTFMPSVMMTADFVYDLPMALSGLIMTLAVLILTVVSSTFYRIANFNPFLISSGLTVCILVGDLLAGAPLAQTSPLSYDAVAGARFYGIGNEYMGVLIGAVIVFSALFLDIRKGLPKITVKKAGITVLFALVVYAISAPSLGTNAGGALAATAGLGTAGLTLYGRRINLKTLLPVAGVALSALALLALFDAAKAVETQSHMGRTIGLIRENGISEAFDVIARKSEVNLRLIRGTTWSWFYFLGLSVVVFRHKLFPDEAGLLKRFNPWFDKTLPAIVVGSLVALVFNDSGIVAAATLVSFAAPALLWELVTLKEGTAKRIRTMSAALLE